MYRRSDWRLAQTALKAIGLIVAASVAGAQARGVKSAPARDAKAAARPAAAAPPDGKKIFATTCSVCHQVTGEGIEEKYPPLAGSEWVADDDAKLVRIILHGLTGPVEVAGQTFSGAMPAWGAVLKDPEVAAVATYIRSAWGNKAAPVAAAKVTGIRAATKSRKAPWTAPELARVASLPD